MRRLIILLAILAAAAAPTTTRRPFRRIRGVSSSPEDWPQFGFDTKHSSANAHETAISPADVNDLRLLFRMKLPAVSDGPPVYWSAGSSRPADHVLFFTATNGALFAVRTDGRLLWQTKPPAGPRWTTSSPVLDPLRDFVYSYALDGRVHKYEIATGEEFRDSAWPVLVTRKPEVEKESSALAVATAKNGLSYLYATIAGYPDPGDAGDYQGHVVAIQLSDGTARTFNVLCSSNRTILGYGDCKARRAGVWGRPGVVYNESDDSVYVVTSNGPFDGKTKWGDSILRLPPDLLSLRGRPLDSYTPAEYDTLDKLDLDLGSSAIALVGRFGQGEPSFAVHAGKDAVVRLVSLDDMSGHLTAGSIGGELDRIALPQGGEVLTNPAVWIDDHGGWWVYLANDNGISAFQVTEDGTGARLVERWQSDEGSSASPVVANGVLFAARNHRIFALDALTGDLLWNDESIGEIHWQSPIVANGALFITDVDANVWAWALRPR